MTISVGDLEFFASLNRPLNDTDPGGGGIDLTVRVLTSINFDNSKVKLISTSALDIQDCVIRGRDKGGYERTETVTLNGTIPVFSRTIFATILELLLNTVAIGIVSVKEIDDTLFHTVTIGEKGATSMFKYTYSSEGHTVVSYDKLFVKNTNDSDDLTDVAVKLSVDDNSVLALGIAGSVNDSVSIATRLIVPVGIVFYEIEELAQLNNDLTSGEYLGIWLKQTLIRNSLFTDPSYEISVMGGI